MDSIHTRKRSCSVQSRKISLTSYSNNLEESADTVINIQNEEDNILKNFEYNKKGCCNSFSKTKYICEQSSWFNNFKRYVYSLKESVQKILTLTDIATDIRTCYIMYFINPYWYTIMLSAIITPFIVFWASSYNFKNVTLLLEKANSKKDWKHKMLSGWLTALSIPIIGIIMMNLKLL